MNELEAPENANARLKVLGVLAGDDLPVALLQEWVGRADLVLAADGGADSVRRCGHEPDFLIGDLDSVQAPIDSFREVVFDPDQFTTDCDKLLAFALRSGYGEVALIGVEGSRPDHELAILHSLSRSVLPAWLIYRTGLGVIVRPEHSVEIEAHGKVSLLPLTPCRGVNLLGVRWELSDAEMDATGLTSISNEGLGGTVSASVSSGSALLYVEGGRPPCW